MFSYLRCYVRTDFEFRWERIVLKYDLHCISMHFQDTFFFLLQFYFIHVTSVMIPIVSDSRYFLRKWHLILLRKW